MWCFPEERVFNMASFAIECVSPIYGDGIQTVFEVDLNSSPILVSVSSGLVLSSKFNLSKPNPIGVVAVTPGMTASLSNDVVTLTFSTAPATGLTVNAAFYLQYAA
jgi:hypothetical protein